jgi:hypothetical protein
MPRLRNGAAGAGTLRKMPIRTARVQLEGDYADFSLEMRSNPPLRVFTEIQANADFPTLRNLMTELIVDWDFVDDQGAAIPVGDLEAIPIDLFGQIVTRYLQTIADTAAVPKA